MNQTSPYSWTSQAIFSIPVTIMLGIGTGGISTPDREELLRERDSGFALHRRQRADDSSPNSAEIISAANDIAFIRSILKASTSDLARCVGVTRQSLYNWRAGSSLKERNADRVRQLKSAATILASEGLGGNPIAVRHPLPGGKTLLETIAGGGDGELAAQTLVTILRDEAEQQHMLERQFANRRSLRPSIESHIFREDG
jgi:DNA-binding transcriptional regulator YiaG